MITRAIQSKGGKAVIGRQAPDNCPRCGISTKDRRWHSYLGHLGLGHDDMHRK